MHPVLNCDLIGRFVSLDRFQGHSCLQVGTVSLPLNRHRFPPSDAPLDTAILSYRPVQFPGTIIPWKYAHFLDYATKRILLRQVGGGYTFIHRLLQEHFASLEPSLRNRQEISVEDMNQERGTLMD